MTKTTRELDRRKNYGGRGAVWAALLCAPAFSFLYFDFGYEVYFSELLLLALLPVAIGLPVTPEHRREASSLCALFFLWISGVAVSALYAQANLTAGLKLGLTVLVLAVDIVVFMLALSSAALYRDLIVRRAALAFGSAGLVAAIFQLRPLIEFLPFKFGYGIPLALIGMAAADWVAKRSALGGVAVVTVFAGLVGASLAFDFRSLGIMLLLTLAIARPSLHWRTQRVRRPSRATALVIAASVALSIAGLYVAAVNSGVLGESARERYVATVGDDRSLVGVIAGGRKEIVFSAHALAENPVFGMGPQPQLEDADVAQIERFYDARGVSLSGLRHQFEDGRIPLHSFVLGAWLTAGVFALPFWIRVFSRTVGCTFGEFRTSYVETFLGVMLLWNMFFSPLGSTTRIISAFTIALILTSGQRARSTGSPNWVRVP